MGEPLETVEETIRIHRGERALEGRLVYPGSGQVRWCALIAGPHPLLGGDMGNNVVHALQRRLASSGAAALTWNYGGVGTSEGGPSDWTVVTSAFWEAGTFEEECEWVEEARYAQQTLAQLCERPLVSIGYSFGCRVIAQGADLEWAAAVILVSPNPKRATLDRLSESNAPLLVIHSTNDFTCRVDEIENFCDTLREPKTRRLIDAGEHFFRGSEDRVADAVRTFVEESAITSESKGTAP